MAVLVFSLCSWDGCTMQPDSECPWSGCHGCSVPESLNCKKTRGPEKGMNEDFPGLGICGVSRGE